MLCAFLDFLRYDISCKYGRGVSRTFVRLRGLAVEDSTAERDPNIYRVVDVSRSLKSSLLSAFWFICNGRH